MSSLNDSVSYRFAAKQTTQSGTPLKQLEYLARTINNSPGKVTQDNMMPTTSGGVPSHISHTRMSIPAPVKCSTADAATIAVLHVYFKALNQTHAHSYNPGMKEKQYL